MKDIDKKNNKKTLRVFLFGTIEKKLFFFFLGAIFLPLIIAGLINLKNASDILLELSLDRMLHDSDFRAREIAFNLENFKKEVIFLANNNIILNLVTNDDISVESNTETSVVKLADVFKKVISVNEGEIYQIRFLNEKGKEVVKVVSKNGEIQQISEENLQIKSNRDYFQEVKKLKQGEFYVSNLNLNKEDIPPKIEIPYTAIIKYASPVYDRNGVFKGAVILNLFSHAILKSFSSTTTKEHYDLGVQYNLIKEFLIDKDGFYMLHPERQKMWGGVENLNTGINIKSDFSEETVQEIFSKKFGTIYLKDQEFVLAYHTIVLNPQFPETFWVSLKGIPESVVLSKGVQLKKTFIFFIFLAIIFAGFLIYFLSRIIARPIKKLREGVMLIEQGDFSHKVGTDKEDEIGILSRAFDRVTAKLLALRSEKLELLEKSKIELEKKVTEKTISLREAQDAVLDVLVDVKKSKSKIEEEKAKSEAIFSSIGEGLVVLDEKGIVNVVNQKALVLLDFRRSSPLGKSWENVLVVQEKEKIFEKDKKTLSFDKIFVEVPENKILHLFRTDKTSFPALISASPIILNNKHVGAVVAFRDVTREMEVDKAKSEFVSLASHQLRTPLSSINWFSEMLMDKEIGELNEKQNSYLMEIDKSSHRMTELVGALLNVSRIELGTLVINPTPTDIRKVMKDVLDELKLAINQKKIKVKIDFQKNLSILNVDDKIIRVAFQNLVSNAVKYTQEGGQIKIEIKEKNKDIIISVADNGLGIPKKFHERIFSKLYRADNVRNTDTAGTGLGLYITKSIIEQSGGKIWFESPTTEIKNKNGEMIAGGTTFYCTIPKTGMKSKKGSRELS